MKTFLALLTFVLLIACSPSVEEKSKEAQEPAPASLNPNGDSELAKLMREMAKFMETTRPLIVRSDSLLPYPENFVQIHTAKSTPGMVDEQTMRFMGSNYLAAIKEMYDCRVEQRKDHFNIAVKACVVCHESVCPGPLKRIGKMEIP